MAASCPPGISETWWNNYAALMVLTIRCQNGAGRKNMYAGPFFLQHFCAMDFGRIPWFRNIWQSCFHSCYGMCYGMWRNRFPHKFHVSAAKKSWTHGFHFWHFCCRFSWRRAYRNNLCPRSQSDIKWLKIGFAHYLTIYVLEHVGVSAPSKTDV